MCKLIFTVLFVSSCYGIAAQTISIVATSGAQSENTSSKLSWTIGELAISTLNSESIILTQGFHQSNLNITEIVYKASPSNIFSVYPNPTNSSILIKANSGNPEKMEISLYDFRGGLNHKVKMTGYEIIIDMQRFNPGSYLLEIKKENNTIATYHIIKQ